MNLLSRGAEGRVTRWLRGTAAAMVTTATVVVFASGSATATLYANDFDGGNGDMVTTTPNSTDWNPLYAAHPTKVVIGPDVPSGTSDNAFGQGAKEDASTLSIVTGSIPPNKNDLTTFYENSEFNGGYVFLNLAWERLVNIGSANMDFEINQVDNTGLNWTKNGTSVTINRSPGDILISYQFSGSGNPTVLLSTWKKTLGPTDTCNAAAKAPCWANQKTLTTPNPTTGRPDAEASVNTKTITDAITPGSLTPGLFGETSINLTTAGVFPAGTCENFGDVFVKSRSSGSSFDSELKDFIAPQSVHINNCSSLTIIKNTTNDSAKTQSFGFSTTVSQGATALPATFSLTGGTTVDPTTGLAPNTASFTKLNAGTYNITENAEPTSSWSYVGYTCDNGQNSGPAGSPPSTLAAVTLALGDNVTCTFTNHYKSSPTLATSLSSSSITVGGTVHDTATLTGASEPAAGTVTYKVWTDNKCTSPYALGGTYTGNSFGAQNLNADGTLPDSPDYKFTNVPTGGKVYYTAEYVSSDGNNANADDITACDEPLTINPATPSASTSENLIPNDSFALSNAYGTIDTSTQVTFNLYDNSNCTGTPVYHENVNISAAGKAHTSNTTPVSGVSGSTATWYWTATWPGDNNNSGASSGCRAETFSITQ